MVKYKKHWLALLGIVAIATTVYALTTTTDVGRMELAHPDFRHEGGTPLHTKVRTAWTSISDNSNSRFEQFTAIADSTLSVHRHNFGAVFAEYAVLIYTGSGASLVRVPDPAGSGWTIAATGANPTLEIDVTTPVAGGPHTFAVVVTHNPQDLASFDGSSPLTTKGDLVGFDGTNNVRVPVCPDGDVIDGDSAASTGLGCATVAVDPMTTRGDITFRNTSNVTARLAVGAADTVFKSDGTDPSYGKIVNANVDAAAAVAGTKIAPDFGSQVVETTGNIEANGGSVRNTVSNGDLCLNVNDGGSPTDALCIEGTTGIVELIVREDDACGIGNVCSGTWTPNVTVENGTFTSGPTISKAYYQRVGNVVSYTIKFAAQRSGVDATVLTFTLPSGGPSTFASIHDAQGDGVMTNGTGTLSGTLEIQANTTDNEIRMKTGSGDTGNRTWQFNGMYLVL